MFTVQDIYMPSDQGYENALVECPSVRGPAGPGPSYPVQAQAIQASIEAHIQPVLCQGIFVQGPGSHYIRIAQSDPPEPPMDPATQSDRIRQLVQTIEMYQQQEQKAHDSVVQAGDLDEATPWLNRTGWVRSLQGIPHRPLVASTKRPQLDADGPQRAALMIWQAMERLAHVSQAIAKQCGHLLRIEVARTTKNEVPNKPLLAYLDATVIPNHVSPWQRILMFFARIQVCWCPGSTRCGCVGGVVVR